MQRLKVDVSAGETLRFQGDGEIVVTLVAKSGQRTRMDIHLAETVSLTLPDKASVLSVICEGLKKNNCK